MGHSFAGIHYDIITDYFYGTSDQLPGFLVYDVKNETQFIHIKTINISITTPILLRSIVAFNGNIYIGTNESYILIFGINNYSLVKNITNNCELNSIKNSKINHFSFDKYMNMYYLCESNNRIVIKSYDGNISYHSLNDYFTLNYLDSMNRMWITGRKIEVFKEEL